MGCDVIDDGEIHLALLKGLTCACGAPANAWMRCRKQRCVVATCGGHKLSNVATRDAHEAACR